MLKIEYKIVIKIFLFLLFVFNSYLVADEFETQKSKLQDFFSSSVSSEIYHAFDDNITYFKIGTQIETTGAGVELLQFYKDGQYLPVWSSENIISPQAFNLINYINHSDEDGLDINNPSYHFQSILKLINFIQLDTSAKNNSILLAQLDILLTDAYIMLAKHLYYGLVAPESASGVWKNTKKKSINIGFYLREALHNNNLKESLEQLLPSSHGYNELKKIMVKYLQIKEAGGWKKIEPSYLNDLKERLKAEGDFSADENSSETYADAIKNFQSRHGLKPDGIIGSKTLSKLNITVEDKISSIRLNLERWREGAEGIENFYILVNIPDFSLSVIRDNKTVLSMKAILGRVERPTPVFSANMSYIVINPYWRVPSTILREDIIPKIRKDIGYLKKEKIKIFKAGDSVEENEINPMTINWEKVNASLFPYILRQDTGAKNTLGRFKFIFPNSYDIYIHDTPARNLFDQNVRLLSSGCIRIQAPNELANYLLENDGNYLDAKNIVNLIASSSNKKISFGKSVKVHINYWTVWADDDGIANFRDDVYGHDSNLAKILGWQKGSKSK